MHLTELFKIEERASLCSTYHHLRKATADAQALGGIEVAALLVPGSGTVLSILVVPIE